MECPSCREMRAQLEEALRRIRKLERDNERLRRALDDARRGGKRQAAPFSKGPPRADPKTPGRKPGNAYGRKAHRPPPKHVDEVYPAPLPDDCPHCHGPIRREGVAQQYQTEIPRRPIHRRFDVEIGRCAHCGRRIQGRHPLQTSDALGAAASQLGPDAQAAVAHLNKASGLSHGKIADFFKTFFEISLSRGGSAQAMLRAGRRAEPVYRSILAHVRRSPVVHPDETGWKVGGVLWWLWAFVTPTATAYRILPSRGRDVPEEILGLDYDGTLVHDGWRPYDAFEQAWHQTCLNHLLSRCAEMLETATRGAVRFPRAIKEILQSALALRDRRDAGEVSAHGVDVARGRLDARLDRLLQWPRSHEGNDRLAIHLLRNRAWLFTFLRVPGVEATNWPAEQAMRPAVVNRKVWGGSRTENGARAQSVLMSVLRTCVQQGRCGLDYISRLLRERPSRPPSSLVRVRYALPLFSGP